MTDAEIVSAMMAVKEAGIYKVEVETSVHSCLESAELEWKKFIYEVYLDNNDFVEFEDFKVEDADFENYGMTIEEREIK